MSLLFSFQNSKMDENTTNDKYLKQVCYTFCTEYYSNMNRFGFSKNMEYFTTSTKCTVDNIDLSCYDLLVKISQQNIHKFKYSSITSNYQPINNNLVLITVSGNVVPISFTNQTGYNINFSEIFIFDTSTNKIVNYIATYKLL